MNWKQRFERALKTGAFNKDDYETTVSWPDCAAGDMLRGRGYNKSYTSDKLEDIIEDLDNHLAHVDARFSWAVYESQIMPKFHDDYPSEDEYRKECIRLVNEAQKIYDEIQNMDLNQALIDKLELTVPPTSA